jgi:hypothetical protein
MQKISTAIAIAAASSGSARDCGIWTISSRSIARRVRPKAKPLRGVLGMFSSLAKLGGESPLPNLMEVKG